MTEVERRSSSTSEVKKDPFRYVPDIIDEKSREVEGMVINRYTKGVVLGKGGFAQVYLSTHLASKQQYALKIVAKASLTKPRAKSKLQTEIKIHRALNHINIVRFQRFFEDSNFAYLVLELCSNNSMADLLSSRKRITETETRYYLNQLVTSLQYLHRHLVIHRDLKLGNIFIDAYMRIKVGDFGLATKLEHENERRMTVCGTPNYIAPELLDGGKKGHSFEVDVWSTGVIMYTLLVGKPPFQSKDVKSTYKRILANAYSYPEELVLTKEAKDLVSGMLQTKPEDRLSLVAILNHAFFTAPEVFIPQTLPETALKTTPILIPPTAEELRKAMSTNNAVAAPPAKKLEAGNGKMPSYGDENDPHAINRLPSSANTTSSNRHATPALNAEQQQAYVFNKNPASNNAPAPLATNAMRRPSSTDAPLDSARSTSSSSTAATSTTANSNRVMMAVEPKQEQSSASRQVVGLARMRTGVSTRSSSTSSTTAPAAATSSSAKTESYEDMYNRIKSNTPNTTASVSTRTASTKFDIYADNSTTSTSTSTTSTKVLSNKENTINTKPSSAARDMPAYNYIEQHIMSSQQPVASTKSTTPSTTNTSSSLVGQIQQDLQQIHLDNHNSKPSTPPPATKLPLHIVTDHLAPEGPASSSSNREDRWKDSSEKLQPKTKRVKEAWISSHTSSTTTTTTATATLLSTPSSSSSGANTQLASTTTTTTTAAMEQPALQSEAMAVSTPPTSSSSASALNNMNQVNIGTLEKMHEMLNENSFSFVDNPNAPTTATTNVNALHLPPSQSTHATNAGYFSKVWVVRYVDYTSKYGLGFLFNTGSAGVYFNDSTKIVLSADGTIFQYVERKSSSSSSASATKGEHLCQKYSMDNYPKELQKKVTLLKHFRNYLLDQEKHSNGQNQADGNLAQAFGGNGIEDCGGYHSARYSNRMENNEEKASLDNDIEMPFLKKWIRTKHAILFRMSNRTVQVVFYDRSEVLLSSEARQITYVNKAGERSEHVLDDIVLSGRVDIAKRLKYTKEIMHRLINAK